ncbi:MAG: hypothetical protein JJLCMIEE_01635 [Acidimicrobiales bacterium]|nr:hypothetical protein [Acidimicrobiales bacterium]
MADPKRKDILAVVDAVRTLEGEGMVVRRAFPTARVDMVDPFLLLDEMGPQDYAPGEAKGAPDHPHRGFEAVTYILDGVGEHEDSEGNHGFIGPGDVQWMTAGSGVIHSEMPSRDIRERGGRMHGFQLWVNLAAADKMSTPRYQDLRASTIPVVERDGARVRVIAGEFDGVGGPVTTHSPINYLHVSAAPGADLTVEVPEGHNAFAYVFAGELTLPSQVGDGQMAVFGAGGNRVDMSATSGADEETEVLLLSGRPLSEPVARYGPFVMNTRAEIAEAVEDYRNGRLGVIRR